MNATAQLARLHDVRPAPAPKALSRIRLFGLDIVDATTDAVITRLLQPGRRTRLAFLNAHCGNIAARNPTYRDALVTAGMILPDGIGVEMAARMSGQSLTENLNGTDFTPRLLQAAARRGLSVFLLGGQPGVAAEAAERLGRDIPGLKIAGTRDGYDGMTDENAAVAAVNASGADILLVALGVPFQDNWLAKHEARLSPRITMGVGALLDFLAGRVKRAPAIVRKARAEWAWRLAMEPRRMARRYLIGNFAFLGRAYLDARAQRPAGDTARRVFDVTVSAAALIILAPILLLTALAIRLESGGPVLFRQTRVGKDGTPFTMLKFRSMYPDAEARRAALLATSDREGICFKSRNDPRITRVGRILRRLSIDELAQILNVLKGDMSIVGPRPALPEEVAAYPERAMGRLEVKPGLTGLWQVSGRAEIGFDKMIDMDLAYIRSRSLLLDTLLLALTARAVIGGRGAY
ncbi:polymer biosynthesis protein, WecB/TagA/CpsF family [Pseudooceanicola antarcticus]|uniref:Polymer biosynthesis protein, WecB/TagA/CpsF family n=1 Tax=Pseudooceanicola antarcticus TaxID=1247613 RepID=A0A285IK13_9RHOB|nr:WecB/TagA/CpsF family glycosyltransferase [Pseudooceanicola antarcticus]PJE29216.1 UDP-phosphate galactose phosphotransferase [Pseudooceanicola antarcticus]SNY48243.1 polymer biosynthesis protein, WecB/TagA/CpsF family [Pseudooceanicola antarcticus]